MKKLTLFRHAKSSWSDKSLTDHQRPLNRRGQRDACTSVNRLLSRESAPDLILCSSSARTRQTAAAFLDTQKIASDCLTVMDELYLASAGALKAIIEDTDSATTHLMLIAHNPGLELLGRYLHPSAPANLPTSAVLHFELNQPTFLLDTHKTIELIFFDSPGMAPSGN